MEERKLLIEADILNRTISGAAKAAGELPDGSVLGATQKRFKMDEDLIQRFFAKSIDEFWHTDKDELEYFQYFSDGTYYCQRKKLVYDFKNDSSFRRQYQFKSATSAQAKALYDQFMEFFYVITEVKDLKVEVKVKDIDKEVVFWEQRWRKLRRQRQEMLSLSDWRVLPDIPDNYTGEKDMWVAWRLYIRTQVVPSPTDDMFGGSGLAYFKYTHDVKFPIDPANYRKLYYNGKLDDGVTDAPAFMDADDADQWVKHDAESSTDFFEQRTENMYRLATRGIPVSKKITNNVLQLMRDLEVDTIIPVDWSRYHVDENEL